MKGGKIERDLKNSSPEVKLKKVAKKKKKKYEILRSSKMWMMSTNLKYYDDTD